MSGPMISTPATASQHDNALRPVEGDWVQVWGQVGNQKSTHPEDVRVTLFSHSDQYSAHVRRDRVTVVSADKVPEHLRGQCTALKEHTFGKKEPRVGLVRCTRHEGHGPEISIPGTGLVPLHVSEVGEWFDDETVGHIEDVS